MRYAARVDVNQPEIVKALRKLGAFVHCLHREGQGCPDLLVGWRQRWWLFEVKRDSKAELTQDEKDWHAAVAGRAPVYIVTSPIEAVRFITDQMPDWLLGLEVKALSQRTHVCIGPKPDDDEPTADGPHEKKERLIERVHGALQTSWRAHTKLSENDLCEMLGASKSSKRVEKALRALCREGRAHREGNNRNAMYWAESST